MNSFLSSFEHLLIGGSDDPRDEALLCFSPQRTLTQRAFYEGVLVLASVGKGKTTLARTLCRALLRDGCGGLVLAVKASQVDEFISQMRCEGRSDDCVLLGPTSDHCFNPLEQEVDPNEATALVSELAEVISGKISEGNGQDEFWSQQLTIVLRNLFTLCLEFCGRLDLCTAADLFDARANTCAQAADPSWRRSSALWATIVKARTKEPHPESVRFACEYFEQTFPSHGDRLQGSIAATVSGVLDHLRRPPLAAVFGGRSTFSMADLLNGGKVCIVAMPALESADGRIANALMQFCFCRAAARLVPRINPAFLVSDECQETVSRELMRKLALLREYKIATVLLSQNLAVLDAKIGQTAREALCGLMGMKIFGPQGHADTRQWAAEQIGKAKTANHTRTTGHGGGKASASTSVQQVLDYRTPPLDFAQLRVGETICLRDGSFWRARWHEHSPGTDGTVAIL